MPEPPHNTGGGLFEIEPLGETIILIPFADLPELEYERIEAEARHILDLLNDGRIKNVVIDFHRTDYYASTALIFFMRLWTRVKRGNGLMAFCNLSDHEKEILQVTKLDRLWPICESREQALQAVRA